MMEMDESQIIPLIEQVNSAQRLPMSVKLDKDSKRRYNEIIRRAKALEETGQESDALALYTEALGILGGEDHKLQKKIKRLQKKSTGRSVSEVDQLTDACEALSVEDKLPTAEQWDDFMYDQATGTCVMSSRFHISKQMYRKLYKYQIEGVKWLYGLYERGQGGILGDDMGLGKTLQVVTFLAGLYRARSIRTALIVTPVSVLPGWHEELTKHFPEKKVKIFSGGSTVPERERIIRSVMKKGGICLTTYGMIQHNLHRFLRDQSIAEDEQDLSPDFQWDFVVLDEGHKIKNPRAIITKSLHQIQSAYRLILTGTPVQNNLEELWSLFDYVCQRRLLGSYTSFRFRFESRIVRGQDKNATDREREAAAAATAALWTLIQPHILQRLKKDVVYEHDEELILPVEEDDSGVQEITSTEQQAPVKTEVVVWTSLSASQEYLYRSYLDEVDLEEFYNSDRSPLAAITLLKKLCGHPILISPMVAFPSVQELVDGSGKLQLLLLLMKQLVRDGHRTLVFSQSKKMLDIIEHVFTHHEIRFLRLDGSVVGGELRQELVNMFNNDRSYHCFLITTGAGGVGLTLTGADRVIIYDPSWNPAVDNQAIDRAYRIGQTRDVVAYRFINCSTVEEKIYSKQIFKDGLIKTINEKMNQQRYFSREELRDMFTLEDPKRSKLCDELNMKHQFTGDEREKIELLQKMESLKSDGLCYGLSWHDLLYSEECEKVTPDNETIEKILQGEVKSSKSNKNQTKDDNDSSPKGSTGPSRKQSSRTLAPGNDKSALPTPNSSSPTADSDDDQEIGEGILNELDDPIPDWASYAYTDQEHLSPGGKEDGEGEHTSGSAGADTAEDLKEGQDDPIHLEEDNIPREDSSEESDNNEESSKGSPTFVGKVAVEDDTSRKTTADPKRICERHEALAKQLSVYCTRCECKVSNGDASLYRQYSALGESKEQSGEAVAALHCYLKAVQTFDGEPAMHYKIRDLSKQLLLC